MIRNYPESNPIVCGYTCIIIVLIVLGAAQSGSASSKAVFQPEIKAANSYELKHNQSAQSVMNELLDPKVFLASAKDQILNKFDNITEFKVNSSLPPFRNSATALLSHQILPPKDFILIYTSAPYTIAKGYLTAKLPCDTDFHSLAYILVGELTNLKPAFLVPVKQLSKPGYLCMYNSYLPPSEFISEGHGNIVVTDVVLFNPTSHRIVLLNTSTIILDIIENLSPKSEA